MREWIYFIHAPRARFAATMTPEESDVWDRHFEYLKSLDERGLILLAGPTLGDINTGIVIFVADSKADAESIMGSDPVVAGGWADGELREFRVSLPRKS